MHGGVPLGKMAFEQPNSTQVRRPFQLNSSTTFGYNSGPGCTCNSLRTPKCTFARKNASRRQAEITATDGQILVKLIERYRGPGYKVGRLEIQKLAYFLQEASEPLRLNFVKEKYGPYADNLNFVLQKLEGEFIRGYGDRAGNAEIFLLPGAVEHANATLRDMPDAAERLESVSKLIAGFETPHGMELLATVHWVLKKDAPLVSDEEAAIARVHAWNARRRYFHLNTLKLRGRGSCPPAPSICFPAPHSAMLQSGTWPCRR